MADETTGDPDFLLRFLEGRDRPCPGCEYNLRDLKSTCCPECGQELTLSLRLVEPRQGALIAGLIGLAAGCGLGGLLLIYAAIMTFMMGRGAGRLDRFIVINAVGFLVHGTAIYIWVHFWNRIRRAPASVRGPLVVVCWALPLIFIVVFARLIH